ncbi:MAG: hypothetical protein EZS28_049702, partial [Streblomastix strix]
MSIYNEFDEEDDEQLSFANNADDIQKLPVDSLIAKIAKRKEIRHRKVEHSRKHVQSIIHQANDILSLNMQEMLKRNEKG